MMSSSIVPSSRPLSSVLLSILVGCVLLATNAVVQAQEEFSCFENDEYNNIFAPADGVEQTCCQQDVCGIPCPAEVPPPSKGMSVLQKF